MEVSENGENSPVESSSRSFEMNTALEKVEEQQQEVVDDKLFEDLKRKLYESETKRLVLISESNKETFRLNSELTRVRKDLEKSEALRQTLEKELASAKTIQMKERIALQEKDRTFLEANRLAEGSSSIYFLTKIFNSKRVLL